MPAADKNLTIKISTPADLAGAKAAEAQLLKDIQWAKQLGEEYKHLEEKLGRNRQAIADYAATQKENDATGLTEKTKEYIKSLEKEDEAQSEVNKRKREAKELLRDVGREFPILSELGKLALNPIIGAFTLLTVVIGSTLEAIKELGSSSTPDFERLTGAIEKQKQAMEDVELAARAYDRSLANLGKAHDSVAEAAGDFQGKAKSAADRETQLMEKNQARQIALIDAAEKAGLVSHEEALRRKLALDEEYAKKRVEIENRLSTQVLQGKYMERANAQIAADALEKGLAGKREAAKQAAGKASLAADTTAKDQADLKATEAKLKELEEKGTELSYKTTGLGKFTTTTPQVILEQQKKQNDAEYSQQSAIAAKLRDKLKQDAAKEFATKDASAAAQESLTSDQDRLTKYRTRVQDLNIELPKDEVNAAADRRQREAVAGIESQTRATTAAGNIGAAIKQDNADQAGAGIKADVAPVKQAADAAGKAVVGAVKELGEVHSQTFHSLQQQLDDQKKALQQQLSRQNANRIQGGTG